MNRLANKWVDSELVFFVILLAIAIFITYETSGYNERVRLVPRLFLIAINVLLVAKIVLLSVNKATGILTRLEEETGGDDESGMFDWGEPDVDVSTSRQLRMIVWLLATVGLVYYLGYLITIPLFLFAFIHIEGEVSIARNALLSLGTTVIIYLFFIELLSMRMYEGVYGPPLPLF